MSGKTKDIDGGWAWVILASGVSCLFLVGFLGYSMGVFNVALLEKYNGDISFTSAVVAMLIGVMSSTGPVAGLMINRFGCRACTLVGGVMATIGLTGACFARNLTTVMWTFGILTGLGYGFCYTAAIVIVGFYFNKLRPLATGVTVSGAGLGMFAGPPIIQLLINHYGLSGTFLLLAAISFHYCVFGSLMRPLEHHKGMVDSAIENTAKLRQDDAKSIVKYWNDFKQSMRIFKKSCFSVYIFSTFSWSVAESACFTHLPAYCIQEGSTKEQAALLYSIMGLTNICSRLFTGFAANDERISKLLLLSGQMSLAGLFTWLFPLLVKSYKGQMAYSALIGLYSCGANTLMSPLAVQLVGLKDLPTAFGFVSLLGGIGYLAGPALAGVIVDRGATYRESYIFAGSMYLLAGFTAIMVHLFATSIDKRDINAEEKARRSIEVTIDVNVSTDVDDYNNRHQSDDNDVTEPCLVGSTA